MPSRNYFLPLLYVLFVSSCGIFKSNIPQPEREFRGFWVATVVNIDWPKNAKDAVEKQKKDYLEILDFYRDMNFNASIVQVRTAGDALYKSDFAPWSRFLTGKEGKAPDTTDNLLQWMINQTHQRGMELHAWINPYRATFDLKTELLSPTHDYYLHQEWMVKYGKKYYYNPGLPEVRQRIVAVIDELVANYDIDAVHFDDYFYPYQIENEVFQDSIAYDCYRHPEQSLEDWRRSNIDSLVENSYKTIKTRKPWVQFGISPFGVWKNRATDPNGSDTKAGQTTYEDLYADPLLWMEKGWLDYLVPQVYWSMELPVASHRKIVDWWAEKSKNTNLYIGNGPYKIRNNSDKAWNKKKELPDQLTHARNTDAVQGNVFFSAKSLIRNNRDVVRYLKRKYYKWDALPPISGGANTKIVQSLKFEFIQKIKDSIILKFNDLRNYQFVTVFPSDEQIEPKYPTKELLVKVPVRKTTTVGFPTEIFRRKKYIALIFIDFYRRKSKPIVVHLE